MVERSIVSKQMMVSNVTNDVVLMGGRTRRHLLRATDDDDDDGDDDDDDDKEVLDTEVLMVGLLNAGDDGNNEDLLCIEPLL